MLKLGRRRFKPGRVPRPGVSIPPAMKPIFACLFAAALAVPAARAADMVPGPLRRALDAPVFAGQGIGLYAVRPDGSAIAAFGAERPLVPASTMKVVTAACALDALGPDFTFRTRFLADKRPGSDGVVRGAVYLVGGGDPMFRAEDLWTAVQDLARSGVKRIAGDVVLDDGRFEPPGRPATWPPALSFPAPYDSPQSALALAWNAAELVVQGGPRPGAPARAETAPLPHLAKIENGVTTAGRTAVTLAFSPAADGPATARLSGSVAKGATFREWIHLGDPTQAVGAALAELLPHAGIKLDGRIRRGAAPANAAALVERRSFPLGTTLAPIMKHSSNFGAEMVARTIAAEAGAQPATIAAGAARLSACLDRWGAPRTGVSVLDGSGYSHGDRLTARALVAALLAAKRAKWGADFEATLPTAAEDGSLRRRLRDMRGRVRAKTGTLDGVHALAGYIDTPGGREVVFAVLVNKTRRGGPFLGHPDVDKLVRAIAAAADGRSSGEEDETPAPRRRRRS